MNCGYPATLHRLTGSSPRQTWVQAMTSDAAQMDEVGANFSESILLNVEFYGITGLNNSFRNACLNNVEFKGACFKGADFTGAQLRNVRFSRDNVGGTTALQGANLLNAQFDAVTFDGVEFDGETKFPVDFDERSNPGFNST